jgi:arylsulfatase
MERNKQMLKSSGRKTPFIRASLAAMFLVAVSVMAVGFAGTSFAQQFDAPYYEFKKKNGAAWAQEDKALDAKLSELQKKYGKKPNIIYILTDDIGYGELGVQGGGAVRGAPTPQLDRMAHEGLLLNGFYSEPSCTPTRVALMTGRHPVRTGLTDVIFPGNPAGLSPKEVTVAELLSDAGYATAMFGKWHLGEGEETWPHNQGFDETLFGVYNTAPYAWNTKGDKFFWNNESTPEFFTRYKLNGIMDAKKGGKATETAPLNLTELATFEEKTFQRSVDFIKRNANGDKPFFLYWASNFVSMFAVHPDWAGKSPQGTQSGDQFMEHDFYVGKLLNTLKELGIAENTLVVWMSDNGPMYDFFPESSSSAYTGGKGDILEGGVHVPAIAWWPGVIEPNQLGTELLHVTDMYTTAVKIGGAMAKLPKDRVIDGLDQSSYILSSTKSRREYMFHYSGASLGAVRMGQYKRHMSAAHGGLPGKAFFDIFKDPKEEHGVMAELLWAWVPFDDITRMHNDLIKKYPHRKPYKSVIEE